MRFILLIVVVPFALLAVASPALARPGISNGGSADQARYATCYATTLNKTIQDAARNPSIAQRTAAVQNASATADKTCQPQQIIQVTDTHVLEASPLLTFRVDCPAGYKPVTFTRNERLIDDRGNPASGWGNLRSADPDNTGVTYSYDARDIGSTNRVSVTQTVTCAQ